MRITAAASTAAGNRVHCPWKTTRSPTRRRSKARPRRKSLRVVRCQHTRPRLRCRRLPQRTSRRHQKLAKLQKSATLQKPAKLPTSRRQTRHPSPYTSLLTGEAAFVALLTAHCPTFMHSGYHGRSHIPKQTTFMPRTSSVSRIRLSIRFAVCVRRVSSRRTWCEYRSKRRGRPCHRSHRACAQESGRR